MARRDPPELAAASQVEAVLGPTNTGKTHLALQRMLAHRTGMIGLPLRLLAREVYDRVVAAKGSDQVALVTGEEKIVPATARFWVCTVEAMPVDRPVAFLAVDEIQLAADPARGHVFTDRLLHARGLAETWFLGSDTIAPLLQRLLPEARIRAQPRLSRLSYVGRRKLVALPPRTAVVAFGVQRVYEIAERLRARHGGAAVVTGALSPRARNAQVALFQEGAVRHLVATDAIGMGLNLDVHHVALAGLRKFDGRAMRGLRPDELAQVAGRAGRHRRDGTFGETAGVPSLEAEVVEALEAHAFPPLTRLVWRNPDLDPSSLDALLASLQRPPPRRELVPVRAPDDTRVLEVLARDPAVRARVTDPAGVRLLWEICGIPDFGGVLPEAHAGLLAQIHAQLLLGDGRLPSDWLARQLDRLDRPEGDLETLTARIAGVRTWTFVANRSAWTDDPEGWQARTRALEDRLSDALHERLTARFVDDRASVLVRAVASPEAPPVVEADGAVHAGGEALGRLDGLGFVASSGGGSAPTRRAVRALVEPLVAARLERLLSSPDEALDVDEDGGVRWEGAALARLVRGSDWRVPGLRLLRHEGLPGAARGRLAAHLEGWLRRWLAALTAELDALTPWAPAARGLVHALAREGGALDLHADPFGLDGLASADRRELAAHGVRLGRRWVVHPPTLDRAPQRRLLWRVGQGSAPPLPGTGVEPWRARWPAPVARALGFVPAAGWMLRVDVAEAVLAGERPASREVRQALRGLVGGGIGGRPRR
ncbi:MAG: hypothetical protein H6732_15625 [Alphaproteobacteria bacterium]|nr:hypothetical protein [Alphaproteobacteria bacterium]